MQTLAPTWNLGRETTAKWYVRLFPSLNDIAFLLPVFVLFARMKGTQLLFSDGDTGWHIRAGEWILSHRAVPTLDLFSFTKPGAAWFAWEWGWDLLAALIHESAGLSGIGFAATLMLGLFSLLVYRLALRASHNHLMSIAVTALVVAASSIHWLARPHLVTWIFTLIFLLTLESVRHERLRASRLLLLLPALMMLWTNLHGGFGAGLLVIGCYAVGEAVTPLLAYDWGMNWQNLRGHLLAAWRASSCYWKSLFLCAAATLVNPYGWQLHKHVFAYLSDSELLDKIQEFQSISFHAGPALFFELLLILAAFSAFENLGKRCYTPVLLICLWAHLALLSARHIPLFAIVAAPFIAEFLATAAARIRVLPGLALVSETLADIGSDLRAIELTPRLHLASAAALLLVAGLFAAGQPPFAAEFNPEAFPLQAIPVIQKYPGSHVFTSDQWGDYLLYRLYPAQRVFFDGRSDFYGIDFVKVNQRIAAAEHDWKSLLQTFSVNLVVLRPETPLSAVLKLTPGAQILFDDGKVIVFDIGAIYQSSSQVSRNGDSSKWVPGSSQRMQPFRHGVALTINRSNTTQKGKTS